MDNDDPIISAQWLHANLHNPNLKILDASWYMPFENRDAFQEYQASHIPGALYFDIDGISDRTTNLPHMMPSEEAFGLAISALEITNENKIIVYDGKGAYSVARVWWMFRVFGHDNIYVLDGGFPKWKDSGFELESCTESTDLVSKFKSSIQAVESYYKGNSASNVTFKVELQPHLIWDLEKIKQNIKDRAYQHIDARVRGRFDGTSPEPRKGIRSGHIPGSKCVPFPDMVDSSQEFLPLEELKKRFDEEGISLDKPIVLSCASGVTACVVAVGLYRLGKKDIPVYDGSWTEWECQPNATIVTIDSTTSS